MPIVIAVLTLFAAPTWRTYRRGIWTLFAVLLTGEASAATELAEITIHIRGEHKAVVSVLLAAADEETPVTGIAELDSLAVAYDLMGIYRKGRRSSFYGYRFRLTFPPGADEVAIAGAYGNISYIQSVEPDPPLAQPAQAELEVARSDSLSGRREAILKKLASGALGGVASGLAGAAIALNRVRRSRSEPEPGTDPSSGYALGNQIATIAGFTMGSMFGAAIGVSLVNRQDNFRIRLGHSLAGSVVGLLGGIGLTAASKGTLWPSLFVGPVVMATAWSERSRKPPEPRRVSFGLSPTLNGGLSAGAQLRF